MPTSPVRSFRFDPPTDAILCESADHDQVTLTEAARRALVTRYALRQELRPPNRLFVCSDPDRPVPPGFTEVRFLGGV